MGIGLFAIEIIGLVSSGEKESLSVVEEHFRRNDLVDYIFDKYKNKFSTAFDNSIYDNAAINKYFSEYAGYIQGNEDRKYGIANEDDGLLLIVSLIFDKVEKESANWKIEE